MMKKRSKKWFALTDKQRRRDRSKQWLVAPANFRRGLNRCYRTRCRQRLRRQTLNMPLHPDDRASELWMLPRPRRSALWLWW